MEIQLLVLEDDAAQKILWKSAVREHNDEPGIAGHTINLCIASTAKEAKDAVASGQYDVFISDLRVPASEGDTRDATASGNSAISFAYENLACPVAIFSAYPQDFERPHEDWPARLFERGAEAFGQAIQWTVSQSAFIELLRNVKLTLHQDTAKLFHRGLWRQWQADQSVARPRSLLRHLAAYLSEGTSVGEDAAESSAGEHYFDPALRDRLHTGDLVQHEDSLWLVLSPPCDMVRDPYPDFVLIAKCEPLDVAQQPWADCIGDQDLSSSRLKSVHAYLRQNISPAQHFLPPLRGLGPWAVRFDMTRTAPGSAADTLLASRIASVSPSFTANIRHRFISFLGRPGQPDTSVESLRRALRERD